MNNTYSYFYIGTTIATVNGSSIKALPLTFLQPAIAKESRAVLINIPNDPLVSSILMIEFFYNSDNAYVVTILNCTRQLRTKKTSEGASEVAMLLHKYKQYIADFYPVSLPRALYVPVAASEQHISQFFRNSNTLKFEACNTYDKGDVILNITELGFAMRYPAQDNFDRNDRYNRLLILQSLMLSYGWHMEKMTGRMIEILKDEKPFDAIFELRNKIAYFNAQYYFHYPVSHTYHELHSFHTLMVKKMNIYQINKELIANSVALEEISKINNEQNEQKFHKAAVVLGLIIAALSMPGSIFQWLLG